MLPVPAMPSFSRAERDLRCFICAQIAFLPVESVALFSFIQRFWEGGISKCRLSLRRRTCFRRAHHVRPKTLLGRDVRDVGLLAQKTIALGFGDDDDADSREPFD